MINHLINDPCIPSEADIIDKVQETANIFTLKIRFSDANRQKQYSFEPGQFNMIYLYGVGEVPISIVSNPDQKDYFRQTVRAIGRVTKALSKLNIGDKVGIRGAFGNPWPLSAIQGKDVLVITGGLGCAPSVSIINYIINRREHYGRLFILQGVKHSDDFIFHQQYEQWKKSPNTEVHVAADQAGPKWPWNMGYVTNMIHPLALEPENTIVMMCGPEMMIHTAIKLLLDKNIPENQIYLNIERNMECAIGQCGHCQYGHLFVCKDGPVFCYPEIKRLFSVAGY